MKKLLTAIVLFVFVALPMSVMAMTTVSDSDLSAVTGQAGVSIGADVTMNLNADIIAWGDSDGIATATGAGWVGLKDLAITNLHMRLRNDLLFFNELLTIDVYTDTVTKVRIGLPTFEITMATMNAKVGLWGDTAGKPGATFAELGTIYVGNMDLKVAPGNYVDISQNETASGVKIVLDNKTAGANLLDSAHFDAISWGDSDGLGGGAAHAGYVGLANVDVIGIKANAVISINVATSTNAYLSAINPALAGLVSTSSAVRAGTLAAFLTSLNPADPTFLGAATVTAITTHLLTNSIDLKETLTAVFYAQGKIGLTGVDIALSGSMTIGEMTATAKLADAKTLVATNGFSELGTIYMKNFVAAIPASSNSWVTISAH